MIQSIRALRVRIDHLVRCAVFRVKYPGVPIVNPLRVGTFYSQNGRDLYLSSLLFNCLSNAQSSWVVDVGCGHPRYLSSSLFLEKAFNCRTLAIDPAMKFSSSWARERPSATFVCSGAGGDLGIAASRASSEVNGARVIAEVNRSEACVGGRGSDFVEESVEVLDLSGIFDLNAISEVLLLLVNIDGFGLQALKSIDLDRHLIRCVVITNRLGGICGGW
jgi:hypothetical protein